MDDQKDEKQNTNADLKYVERVRIFFSKPPHRAKNASEIAKYYDDDTNASRYVTPISSLIDSKFIRRTRRGFELNNTASASIHKSFNEEARDLIENDLNTLVKAEKKGGAELVSEVFNLVMKNPEVMIKAGFENDTTYFLFLNGLFDRRLEFIKDYDKLRAETLQVLDEKNPRKYKRKHPKNIQNIPDIE